MALSFAYQLFDTPPPGEANNLLIVAMIVGIGVLLMWYAMRQRAAGVLR